MPQSLAQLYVHLIFSTKNRAPLLKKAIRADLAAYIAGILKRSQSPALAIGIVADHVHLVFRQSKNSSLAEIVEHVKSGSSKWLKTQGKEFRGFYWQNGYAALSVSASRLDAVKHYVENQEVRHTRTSYQEELRRFLDAYAIAYDERYIWD